MKLKKWLKAQFRRKSRVYIMPTKMGGYLNALIFLMFLLALGYNNNLLLIFTLFLFAFNLLWLIQTHFHLHALKLDHLAISAGHAGDFLSTKIFWSKLPKAPWDWAIVLESDAQDVEFHLQREADLNSEGEVLVSKRGAYHWRHIKIKSSRPFGLYQTWIYFPVDLKTMVYPTLLNRADTPLLGKDLEGDLSQDKKGQDEFRGLSPYAHGESRKISWKHYARSGELLIKEGEDKKSPILEVLLHAPQDPGLKEQYLSYVATQLVECYRREIPFSLKTPEDYFPSGTHGAHLHECLKALALC